MSKQIYEVHVYDGSKSWYQEGKLHRDDGPAIEYANGTKKWYQEGKLHRDDGPAIEYANGTKNWYLKGMKVSEEEHTKRTLKDECEGKVVEIEGRKYKLVCTS